jgi:hypothetical protein
MLSLTLFLPVHMQGLFNCGGAKQLDGKCCQMCWCLVSWVTFCPVQCCCCSADVAVRMPKPLPVQ